jgi:hypothetical protein
VASSTAKDPPWAINAIDDNGIETATTIMVALALAQNVAGMLRLPG